MKAHANSPDAIAAEAAHWVRRRDAGLDDAGRRELRAWLAIDPRHAAAFARADRARTELDWPLHAGALDEILVALDKRSRQRRTRRRAAATLTLATAAAVALGLFLRAPEISPPLPARDASVALAVPTVLEPRTQTLPDGSVVELKAGAAIREEFTADARGIVLERGTAHFTVAKDPQRPFVVRAAGVAVQAVGTEFVVELETREVTVVVTEGRVAVNPRADTAPAATTLGAGDAVVLPVTRREAVSTHEVRALPPAEIQRRLAWRIPRLEFSGTPLPEVVARINQHNRKQFVIEDRALDTLVLSGVLRADKIDALVDMLESDFPVQAERNGERIVLRSR